MKALIAKFYSDLASADEAWQQHPLKKQMLILEFPNGYLLVSKKQAEKLG